MKITISREGKTASGGIGIVLEDVNYAFDGGLYAELLENRNFEAKRVRIKGDTVLTEEDGSYGWEAIGGAELKIKSDRPLFAENPHYLRLKAPAGGGVRNRAYGGFSLAAKTKYTLVFYVRSYDYRGKCAVGVYHGETAVSEKKVRLRADGKWRRFCFRLTVKQDVSDAEFRLTLSGEGTVHLDTFSLMPESAIKGIFRRDLAERIKALNPAFVRFPGGSGPDGYPWKETLRPVERRTQRANERALGSTLFHYGQTFGIGIYECFLFCEYLGSKPMPIVSLANGTEEDAIQDALDLLEFALGESETEWGRARREMGRTEPFRLEYLAVDGSGAEDLFSRYARFEKAIHARYPALKLVLLLGTNAPLDEASQLRLAEELAANGNFLYAAGERVSAPREWYLEHARLYDGYRRGLPMYAADLSANGGSEQENAIAEAAFLAGAEQNADVVLMSSYAPLLERKGYAHAGAGMIRFDGHGVFRTASMCVQELFLQETGNFVLKTASDDGNVFASASEREGGLTFLKAVNSGDEPLEAEIGGDYDFGAMTRIVRMDGGDESSCLPYEIAPVAPRALTLPPHTFSVIIFHK